jgi:hypothetical protein
LAELLAFLLLLLPPPSLLLVLLKGQRPKAIRRERTADGAVNKFGCVYFASAVRHTACTCTYFPCESSQVKSTSIGFRRKPEHIR